MQIQRRLRAFAQISALIALPALFGLQSAQGGETDISNQPLATRPAVQAKPNLMFILDDSGSMNWSYMPDDLGASNNATDEPYTNWFGYRAAQCNGVAYDPKTTYEPPLKHDGSKYPNANFSAAKRDGYATTSTTDDLDGSYYYDYTGSQPRMDWRYTSSGKIDNTFYKECSTKETSGSSVFTKVIVKSTSSEAQNYANWYSYYRKRYLLMRTAMGRALAKLDNNYRVGFSTINDTGITDGSNHFRDIKDFDGTQRERVYGSLYGSTPNGGTPLRTALSKAGRYFAKKVPNQTHDPMQYACQRNYALLSTDGYWNGGSGVKLDGKTVGQQDGTEDRPMRDDSQVIKDEITTFRADATRFRVSNVQGSSRTWTRTKYVASEKGASPCSSNRWRVTTINQRYIETRTQQFTTKQTATATYTRTTTTTDGVVTAGPTDSTVSYGTFNNVGSATTETSGSGSPTSDTGWTDVSTSTNSCSTSQTKAAGTTTYTTASAGSWSSWTPTLSYTNTTPTLTPWIASGPVIIDRSDSGTPNTLADVAQYYYITDLRDKTESNCTSNSSGSDQDVCDNIVRATAKDPSVKQHMNTFTIGLGLKGTLPYDVDTLAGLTDGSIQWPSPSNAGSTTSGSGDATNIDDLWHTAINGRGDYYSAQSATELSSAINAVMQSVGEDVGASSAASTSSLELVAGENNYVYRASYTTRSWFGDLEAFTLNGKTAAISPTPSWSARKLLDDMNPDTRRIYFKGKGGLTEFTYANLDATQQAYFRDFCTQAAMPDQCTTMSAVDKAYANDGNKLVNYLRGARTHESTTTIGTASVPALYRKRTHLLGDIINGAPVHVGKPPFSYADTGYAAFVADNMNRKPVVYVAANDGMLHAISAQGNDGGKELWAYIPGSVMPNLYRLADNNYANDHQYYVDGAPVMGDIQVDGVWKTILVGGLGKGGKSYYALDITDPQNPVALWEFTDANMGLSYGNPIIAKRADGTWIVALTSGYNNGGGDGKGHLYVLNAATGELLLDLVTSAGSKATPSGLAKINAWVDDPSDNTAKRFYGGDQLGNVWRFDIDNQVLPHQAAMLLAELKLNDGTPQPITTKPVTAEIANKAVVIVATGRYMGDSDITDTTQQGIYAIKDPLTATGWGNVRNNTNFVVQTLTLNNADPSKATQANVSTLPVDWASKAGWRLDLPHSRERVFSNMGLQLGTLAIGTAIPSGDACASGGASWRYYLNLATGSTVADNPVGVLWSDRALIVGISWVKDTDGNVRIIYQNSDSTILTDVPPVAPSSGAGSVHRTSWRELAD